MSQDSCSCSHPNGNPPCGWCTDPLNNPDLEMNASAQELLEDFQGQLQVAEMELAHMQRAAKSRGIQIIDLKNERDRSNALARSRGLALENERTARAGNPIRGAKGSFELGGVPIKISAISGPSALDGLADHIKSMQDRVMPSYAVPRHLMGPADNGTYEVNGEISTPQSRQRDLENKTPKRRRRAMPPTPRVLSDAVWVQLDATLDDHRIKTRGTVGDMAQWSDETEALARQLVQDRLDDLLRQPYLLGDDTDCRSTTAPVATAPCACGAKVCGFGGHSHWCPQA